MKVVGFTVAGAAIYLSSGDDAALRHDLAGLSLTTRVLDGTPYEGAITAASVPYLSKFDEELAAAGLAPVSLDPPQA